MATPTPFRFDGHGINDANGQRIAKVSSCDPYVYPDGKPVRNTEFDALSQVFAAAPELLEVMHDVAAMLPVAARLHPDDLLKLQQRVTAVIAKAHGEAI